MSIGVMTEVWQHSRVRGNGLLLMLALADHSNDEAVCWPSVESLAHKTRTDRRTVQRQLRSLEEAGLIQVVAPATQHRTPTYQLHPRGGSLSEDQGRQSVPPGAAPPPPETSEEPSGSSSSLRSEADGDGFMQVQDPPEPSALFDELTDEDKAIARVWAHYCERSTPVSTELTPARKRMLKHALKECTEQEMCLAIDGNRLSSWHRERGKHHLSDIFGRPKPPTTLRAKIDRFIGDAQRSGGNLAPLASATMTGYAREMKDAVITAATYSSDSAKEKGAEAVEWLAEHGIEVTFNDEGWPTFSEKEDQDA